MRIGIVGVPNAGKSTLFNALTQAGAQTGDYPFTTVEPNVAVVSVPDQRLPRVAEAAGSAELVPETVSFVDIAGLVRGASEGEGLGNRFLAEIREVDAICHLVRCHDAPGVPHPEGDVDPARDLELVDAELCAADLEQASKRLERVVKQARAGDPETIAEREWLESVTEALSAGRAVRTVAASEAASGGPARLQALTAKPVLYVANVEEGSDAVPATVADHARATQAVAIAISARIEAELAEVDASEREELRAELGIGEPGLERLVRAAFELLGLVTFFTAHSGAEATARSLPRGSTAWDAAGRVHTDFQSGFVRAEVIDWEQLVEAGGYATARERGLLRTEGRDYVVAEGDVITIRN